MTLATLLALSVMSAAPEALPQAAQALEALQYEDALQKLPPEAEVRGFTRAELITYFATRARAELGLKKDADAAESFRKLFTFAPEWKLPDEYGPRFFTLVASWRAEAEERGALSIAFEAGQLKTTFDTTGLAKELEVSWRARGGAVKTLRLPLAAQQPAPWPRDEKVDAWGRLLGLEGSTLHEWHSEAAPLHLEPAVGAAPAPLGGLALSGLALGGLGTAAAGLLAGAIGAGLAADSISAEKALAAATRDAEGRISSLSQRDAFALDARAAGAATGATALFVTGGVLVAAGVSIFVFDRVSVTPTPGGALLTVPLDAHFAVIHEEMQR